VALPPEFDAVMVYVAFAVMAVGVPVMAQVVVLSDKPVGNAGAETQPVIGPPVFVAVTVEIAKSFV
jgi:hypothetical protein